MFTPEELEEMRNADKEIERSFRLTMDELQASRVMDRGAKAERLCNKAKKIAAAKREYYAANRDKIAAAQREYRAANRKRTAFADLLARKSISQADAAQEIGVSQVTISNWALGICPPNVGKIRAAWPEYGGEL